MKKNFTNENFEEFLRQNAENFYMRPSTKVWEGISKHFNRRRIISIVLAISVLITTGVGYYFFTQSTHLISNKEMSKFRPVTPTVEQTKSNNPAVSLAHHAPKISKNISRPKLVAKALNTVKELKTVTTGENIFTPTIIDSYDEIPMKQDKAPATSERSIADPLTIESIINYYHPAHNGKIGLQLYFTPTVGFRRVNDNTIDNIAPHKPNFGFEVGLTGKYPLSKNLKIKGGFQFNVNGYSVKTFDTYTQTATIRVNEPNGFGYVNTLTNYNNFSGYKSKWLQNFYFQISAPVGVELKLKGDNATQFGIASTLQPTYLLGGNEYLISTDYKNYAAVPNLIRHWNLNTSLETYVAYSTGHLKWQVGPQVRYQLLSSYIKKYPVKENLFDFGLKVGLSLNNPK